MTSTVRFIKTICEWISFSLGSSFNLVLLWLIIRHTPQSMRLYSKILLQTCLTDLALVSMTIFNDVIFFVADGGTAMWNNGLLKVTGREWIFAGWLLEFVWMLFIYISMFNFVAQFIFRYLTLNRSMQITPVKYFALWFCIQCIPLLYVIVCGSQYYPIGTEHEMLKDQDAATILGLNVSDGVYLSGYSAADNVLMKFAFYYNIITCLLGYLLILVLGYLMHRFVRQNMHGASNSRKKTLELQRQLTRLLIVQAALPATIIVPLVLMLTTVAFSIDLSAIALQMQYYDMLSSIPMYMPAAVNPLVAILLIRDYRETVLRIFRHTFFWRCCRHLGRINVVLELKPLPSISNSSNKNSIAFGKPNVSTGLTSYLNVGGNSWGPMASMAKIHQQHQIGGRPANGGGQRFG